MNPAVPASGLPSVDRVKMIVHSKSKAQPPVMAALVQQLEAQKARLEFEVLTEPGGIVKAVEQTTMTVLILTLHQKEEVVEVLNVLTQVQGRLQSGLLRAMVLNGLNHPRVIALLKAKGVQEIVDFNTNIKSLNHKIKNAFLLVTQTFQRLQNQNIRASTVLGGEAGARGRGAHRNESSSEIQWEKSLEHPSDIWWIPSAKNLRNVMGRWLMDILGPGPAAGFWEELHQERNGEKGWVWKARVAGDSTFMPRPGRWIFFGRQPEFVWQKNLWAFVSKMPYLAFFREGDTNPEFIRIDSPTAERLKVFENSEISQSYLPKIQASLEASLKLSKADAGEEARGGFETAPEGLDLSGSDLLPSSSALEEGSAGDWNDHTGAIGFGFTAKNLRVGEGKGRSRWRNALDVDLALGANLGLGDIRQSGVTAGAKTFERVILEVRPDFRNGVELARKDPVRVIELTANRALFEFARGEATDHDVFRLKVEFQLGAIRRKFGLEWKVETIQSIVGAGGLVLGSFGEAGAAELREIHRLMTERELELKKFFQVARGA